VAVQKGGTMKMNLDETSRSVLSVERGPALRVFAAIG